VKNWGIGAVPSYKGNITAKLHADNFRIMETTKHPEEAFNVMLYLTNERGAELLQIYGGMPARQADQDAFFKTFTAAYPDDISWATVVSALSHADVPSHESNMPNFAEGNARIATFSSLLQSTPDLDLNAEIDKLQADLQAIFDRAKGA